MTYQEGDPGHLSVHNALTTQVSDLAGQMAVEVVLPNEAVAGQKGHVDAHNMIVTALDKIAAEGVPPAPDSFVQGAPTSGSNANSSPAQLLVKKKDGTRMTAHVLPGNTGDLGARLVVSDGVELSGKLRDKVAAITVPDDFTDDVVTLLPKDLTGYADSITVARIPHPSAEYAVTLPPGVLQGVLIAAGGSGGSTSMSNATYSGGGGAGGVIGLNRTPIVIPGEPNTSATFTVTVASTTPKGTAKTAAMDDILNGQPTFIKDGNGLVIACAVGGGHGGGEAANRKIGPSQGGSGGGGADRSALYWRNGLGVPGQGNDGGHSGTLSGGGGGAFLPGNETNGGAGVDLIALLDLDPNDSGTQSLASMFTDNGYVGGGGGGYPNGLGGTGGGGDAWYSGGNDPRDGQDHTGGGGGGTYNTTGVAAGGAGMAVLLAPAT